MVLPDTRLAHALVIAGRMRGSVYCRPLTIDDMQLHGTLSIGVAELAAGETTEALFGRADAALYASKAAGRDRVTGASDSPEEAVPA